MKSGPEQTSLEEDRVWEWGGSCTPLLLYLYSSFSLSLLYSFLPSFPNFFPSFSLPSFRCPLIFLLPPLHPTFLTSFLHPFIQLYFLPSFYTWLPSFCNPSFFHSFAPFFPSIPTSIFSFFPHIHPGGSRRRTDRLSGDWHANEAKTRRQRDVVVVFSNFLFAPSRRGEDGGVRMEGWGGERDFKSVSSRMVGGDEGALLVLGRTIEEAEDEGGRRRSRRRRLGNLPRAAGKNKQPTNSRWSDVTHTLRLSGARLSFKKRIMTNF